MCGIAGWLGRMPEGEQCAIRMLRALRHRGPDSHGVQAWPEATLVHTRLSIIDLSPTGAQPMSNQKQTVWTVFNGEIYNHRQLRHGLELRGHLFRGHSDTEVLPHLYEESGSEFVRKLRGMFAFAIYDQPNRKLTLYRDRFGIKPLFYSFGKDFCAFASEINTLLELPGINRQPDTQAIYDYSALFYVPAPETFYVGIRALEPGEILEATFDGQEVSVTKRKYHSWTIALDPVLTSTKAVGRVDELLTSAVERQLESEVPLGCLLSGGIDSSLISVAAQRALQGELKTFNVRFSTKEYDETWAARLVAEHIGTHHLSMDMDDVPASWDHLTDLLSHAGQPFADTSLFAVNAICRLMRQHVTVAISGDGGDEAFGGYDIYWRLSRIARWQRPPAFFLSGASMAVMASQKFIPSARRLSQRMKDLANADDVAVVQSLFCALPESEHKLLFGDTDLLPVRRLFERKWQYHLPTNSGRVERLSAYATEVNTRLTLPNDFLFKVDTASMKESLEVRVPMLDEELFEFGLSLPRNFKVKGRTCKRVLRDVAARRLPAQVANKPKWGFAVPLENWVGIELRSNMRDALLDSSSKLPGFFRPEVYQPLAHALCNGDSFPMARHEVFRRAIMLLSVQLALSRT